MDMSLKTSLLAVSLLWLNISFAQTPEQILTKSYEYHDPQKRWSEISFEAAVHTQLAPPMAQQIGQESVITEVTIDNTSGNFRTETIIKGDTLSLLYSDDSCELMVNGHSDIGEEMLKKHMAMVNLTNCETARPAINYHIYLMGLPMKLLLDKAKTGDSVEEAMFFDRSFYAIKVDYPDNMWTFYFDKLTFALRGCEFQFKSNGFGEKILLEEEIEVEGIRMFGKRTWYTLDGGTLLATDVINFGNH